MNNKIILKTLNKEQNSKVPVWLMRQAGRYLPEYREIRSKFKNFLDVCYDPHTATEITLQPIRRFDLDAAIIFSDILVIPDLLGSNVEFTEKLGPTIHNKIQTIDDIRNLKKQENHKIQNVYKALELTREKLPQDKALIGFSGAPWTLACYMVDGRSTKNFQKTKDFAYNNPKEFQVLIDILTEEVIIHLINQIKSGAEILQIFDSWSGILNYENFYKFVILPTKKIIASIKKVYPNIPIIGFPKDSNFFYQQYAEETNVDAVSLDSNFPLDVAIKTLSAKFVLQGNLDPCYLLSKNTEILEEQINNILDLTKNINFIFNLGHGMVPESNIELVEFLVKTIRNYTK